MLRNSVSEWLSGVLFLICAVLGIMWESMAIRWSVLGIFMILTILDCTKTAIVVCILLFVMWRCNKLML